MDVNMTSPLACLLKLVVVLNISLFSFAACAQSSSPVETEGISEQEKAEILQKYDYIDPQNMIPTKALSEALVYFDKNQNLIRNKSYLAVIDFSKNSASKRFFIVNMKNGIVWNIHVAHGKGSDQDHDGMAESFGNENSSHKSSLGFYLTNETYVGDHGLSLRLDGLSKTNSRARERDIVIHGAEYVKEVDEVQGRSFGCPAVDMRLRDTVIRVLKDGSLIYAAR
jgi:hypothetical protein